jgi:hypothetical protein
VIRRGSASLLTAALAVAGLCGCAQIEALAPVGGDRATEIRFATIDVLLDADVHLLEAPTCIEAGDKAVHCTGTTVGDDEVSAVSTADDPAALIVTVGDEVLYRGTIDDVISKAIRP